MRALGSSVVRKIWVISELYYPEETSTGYYITKISEDLAKSFPLVCFALNQPMRHVA